MSEALKLLNAIIQNSQNTFSENVVFEKNVKIQGFLDRQGGNPLIDQNGKQIVNNWLKSYTDVKVPFTPEEQAAGPESYTGTPVHNIGYLLRNVNDPVDTSAIQYFGGAKTIFEETGVHPLWDIASTTKPVVAATIAIQNQNTYYAPDGTELSFNFNDELKTKIPFFAKDSMNATDTGIPVIHDADPLGLLVNKNVYSSNTTINTLPMGVLNVWEGTVIVAPGHSIKLVMPDGTTPDYVGSDEETAYPYLLITEGESPSDLHPIIFNILPIEKEIKVSDTLTHTSGFTYGFGKSLPNLRNLIPSKWRRVFVADQLMGLRVKAVCEKYGLADIGADTVGEDPDQPTIHPSYKSDYLAGDKTDQVTASLFDGPNDFKEKLLDQIKFKNKPMVVAAGSSAPLGYDQWIMAEMLSGNPLCAQPGESFFYSMGYDIGVLVLAIQEDLIKGLSSGFVMPTVEQYKHMIRQPRAEYKRLHKELCSPKTNLQETVYERLFIPCGIKPHEEAYLSYEPQGNTPEEIREDRINRAAVRCDTYDNNYAVVFSEQNLGFLAPYTKIAKLFGFLPADYPEFPALNYTEERIRGSRFSNSHMSTLALVNMLDTRYEDVIGALVSAGLDEQTARSGTTFVHGFVVDTLNRSSGFRLGKHWGLTYEPYLEFFQAGGSNLNMSIPAIDKLAEMFVRNGYAANGNKVMKTWTQQLITRTWVSDGDDVLAFFNDYKPGYAEYGLGWFYRRYVKSDTVQAEYASAGELSHGGFFGTNLFINRGKDTGIMSEGCFMCSTHNMPSTSRPWFFGEKFSPIFYKNLVG
jgi:hypothetical protein